MNLANSNAVEAASEESTKNSSLLTRHWSLIRWCARLALGLLIIGVLLWWRGDVESNFSKVQRVLQTVPWYVVVGSIFFYWAGQLLSAARWQLLLNSLLHRRGARISLRECCRLYLVGMFWNLWMPTTIGGDTVRAYLAGAQCGSKALAASSILVERLSGFLALLAIGGAGFVMYSIRSSPVEFFNAPALKNSAYTFQIIGAALLTLLLFCAVLIAARAAAYRLESRALHNKDNKLLHKALNKWAALHRALDLYLQPERRLALAMAVLLSLIFQASQIVLNIILARAVNLNLPINVFWWLVPLLAIAAMLPIGIGGLGVRETAAVTMLQGLVQGLVSTEAATGTIIAWSLLWQATVWLASLAGIFVIKIRNRAPALPQLRDE